VNLTGNDTRRVDMTAGISYSDDIGKARDVLLKICKGHKLVLDEPAVQIEMSELGDSSVNFVVRPWCKTADYWAVYFDVMRSIKDEFDAKGISIPFPQRDVHLYKMKPE
jgi:small conductance mechanosensitive channel